MNNRKLIAFIVIMVITVAGVLSWVFLRPGRTPQPNSDTRQKVVINEAVHTLLYLPLYHAVEGGFFDAENVAVEIITGGTSTNSFAAMLSGEADFSQADPMYVPISREKGGQTKVVAQVVGRIAVWGVTMDPQVESMTADSMRNKKISTHPQPMTAYTYTLKTIRDAGLEPDLDVEVIQSMPGTEIVPLLSGQADFAMTLEPNTSRAVVEGAHVVLSYPTELGDQIFTALMTREEYIENNRDTVVRVIRAYQHALQDIHANPDAALATAAKYFPQIDACVLELAVDRMIGERVIPESIMIKADSWERAIAVRVAAGDLQSPSSREENCALDIIGEAIK